MADSDGRSGEDVARRCVVVVGEQHGEPVICGAIEAIHGEALGMVDHPFDGGEPAPPAPKWLAHCGRGVTRSVRYFGDRWVVKYPRRGFLVRGWLANQSEWRQRHGEDVMGPVFTLCHVAIVMRQADYTIMDTIPKDERFQGDWDRWERVLRSKGYDGDEAKPTSWGFFGHLTDLGGLGGGYRLIDFDRAWDPEERSLVGRLYYWNQERLARRWSALTERAS